MYGLCQDGQMTASSKNFQIAAFSSRHLSENRDLNQIMCNLSILGTMTMAVLVRDDFFKISFFKFLIIFLDCLIIIFEFIFRFLFFFFNFYLFS